MTTKKTVKPKKKVKRTKKVKQLRYLYLYKEINQDSAEKFISQFKEFESSSIKDPIVVYLCSPGGSVTYGWTIVDCILYSQCPVFMVASGEVASMAVPIFVAAHHRIVTQHTRFMLHPTFCGLSDYLPNLKTQLESIERVDNMYTEFLAERTDLPAKLLSKSTKSEVWISVEDAVKYKIADEEI